jgi:L-malate glycosyltransferase
VKLLLVNHTSARSGAEMSLLDLIANLPAEVTPTVACPSGELARAVEATGVPALRIPAIDASLRPHPLHTTRGVAQVTRVALTVRRLAAAIGADLVYANSTRAGLATALAARLGAPPTLVHVRDCLPASPIAGLTRWLIARNAAAVLANSGYTASSFASNGDGVPIRIVYGPVDVRRLEPVTARADARARMGLDEHAAVLGVVGQITPWKGHDTAIEAFARVREQVPHARLMIAGDVKFSGRAVRYDNARYLESLRRSVRDLGLGDSVRFLGQREDVGDVLRALDLLLLPSWEEPFGRTVVEAMAVGTPVLATRVGGPAEIIEDRVDGRLLEPRASLAWADAACELLLAPEVLARMAASARAKADRFAVGPQVAAFVDACGEALHSQAR